MQIRKMLGALLVLTLIMSSLTLGQAPVTHAEERPFVDYRYTPNPDGTIFIEGVADNSKNATVRLKVSTRGFVNIGKNKESKSVTLFEQVVSTNTNGYFSVTTTPIDAAQVQESAITISVYNEQGRESSISPKYPLDVPNIDMSVYYEDPDIPKEGPYDKFKDGYIPPMKNIDYSLYGVGKGAPVIFEAELIKQVTNPVSVAASDTHVIALTADGSLYGWGNNLHNEINNSSYPVLPVTKIGMLSNVRQVEAGERFSLYLTKQGELYGWGDLNYLGVKTKTGTPQKITLVPEAIRSMKVYSQGVVLLTNEGNVYQLGGAYGPGVLLLKNHVRKLPISDVTDIAIGDLLRAYAVKKDGTVWYWQTTIVDKENTVSQIEGFKNIKQIDSAGDNNPYLLALDNKGNLWAWGSNGSRQLGFNVTQYMSKPTIINKGPIRIKKDGYSYPNEDLVYKTISAGDEGALVLTDKNEMLFMGYNAGTVAFSTTKEGKNSYKNVTLIETSNGNMYWASNGKLWVSGNNNQYGQLGFGVKL
ncbi:hypothetical protein A3848_07125 [Paenibacillus sp. P32E]|nr:hypothetical protein A3848_07125 [Paenibacillus sp. P32E]